MLLGVLVLVAADLDISTVQELQKKGLSSKFVEVDFGQMGGESLVEVENLQHIEMGTAMTPGFARPQWKKRYVQDGNRKAFYAMCPPGTQYIGVEDPAFKLRLENVLEQAVKTKFTLNRPKKSFRTLSPGGKAPYGAALYRYGLCVPPCGSDGSCSHVDVEFQNIAEEPQLQKGPNDPLYNDTNKSYLEPADSSRRLHRQEMAMWPIGEGKDNMMQKTTFAESSCVLAGVGGEGVYCGLVCIPDECNVAQEPRPHGVDGEQWGSCCPPDSACEILPGREITKDQGAPDVPPYLTLSEQKAKVEPVDVGLCMYRQSGWKSKAVHPSGLQRRGYNSANPYKKSAVQMKRYKAMHLYEEFRGRDHLSPGHINKVVPLLDMAEFAGSLDEAEDAADALAKEVAPTEAAATTAE